MHEAFTLYIDFVELEQVYLMSRTWTLTWAKTLTKPWRSECLGGAQNFEHVWIWTWVEN